MGKHFDSLVAAPSYYHLLGVKVGASPDELKQAYRRQALKYHPDTNQGDPAAASLFVLVKNAYDALTDPQRREEAESFARTSGAVKARSSVAPRPGRVVVDSLRPFENDLNDILWDLDDLVNSPSFPQGFRYGVMDFLTYLDKWVLMPAGFTPSPAREAREGARDPRSYLDHFVYHRPGIPCEFRSLQDYFFDVKHRVMGFQAWTDGSLLSEIKGARLLARLHAMKSELLYQLMRSQRIGFYYLFEFERVRNGTKPRAEPFVHESGP